MKVVVVGAGQAGLQVASSLRELGFPGRIVLLGDEGVPPYQRPPLSKAYLAGPSGVGRVVLRGPAYYQRERIELDPAAAVVEIDRAAGRVLLSTGRCLAYDRLVLALGARARCLEVPGADLDGVLTLRTVADADAIRARLDGAARRLVVIGGGFVGMELAASASAAGHAVTVVEAADRPLARAVTPAVSEHLTAVHRAQGTVVLAGRSVRALLGGETGEASGAGEVAAVELDDGAVLPADAVVVGVGAVPSTALAAAAGLAVQDGILVDASLHTADPAIAAVGDCARFPSPWGPLRLESVQNAVDQARFVAAGICGGREDARYDELPCFWSAQFAENLQIAGIAPGHATSVTVGDRDAGRFSVLSFTGDELRAVESLNRPVDHMAARRLIGAGAGPSPLVASQPGFALLDHARAAGLFESEHDRRAG